MSYRIINLAKPVVLISSSSSVKKTFSITQMIANLHGKKESISVPSGVYRENVTIPDGVSLMGNGTVQIHGNVFLHGEGILSYVDMENLTVVDGNRVLVNCSTNLLTIEKNSYVDCRGSYLTKIISNEGKFIVRNSSIGTKETAPSYTVPSYTIEMENSIGVIESSTIEGSTKLGASTILDCKQTCIVGKERVDGEHSTEDLFETFDETTTLQLFNCTVYGYGLVKSGLGTSIRANVIALSDAVGFEGGENIKIESI